MAYSTTNPPMLVTEAPLTGAGQMWRYASTHTGAEADAAGFFTNAKDLGMRAGDLLINVTTAYQQTMHSVLSVSSTGADLGDGTTVGTSTANTD